MCNIDRNTCAIEHWKGGGGERCTNSWEKCSEDFVTDCLKNKMVDVVKQFPS